MAIDRFTKEQFEAALPVHKDTATPLWSCGGFSGEYVYYLTVAQNVRIKIWSSIEANGLASDTGCNSIRCFLVDANDAPLSNKLQTYVTRVNGWDVRLKDQLKSLWKMGLHIGKPCDRCGTQKRVFMCKKEGPNKGRLFTSCPMCSKFEWLVS